MVKDLLATLSDLRDLSLYGIKSSVILKDIIQNSIQTNYLNSLALINCEVNKDCLNMLIHHPKVANITKLDLSCNILNFQDVGQTLKELIEKFKSTLCYLDLSCCHIDKQTIMDLIPRFVQMNVLETLLIYDNPGATYDVILNEILPLFGNRPINLPLNFGSRIIGDISE